MIIAHSLVGIGAGNYWDNFWPIFLGSIFPDIDHFFIILKYKLFSFGKIIDSIRFEEKYSMRYKTKFVHSMFGAIIFSSPVLLIFGREVGLYFFIAYIFHLILDWPDCDEKYYLFPLKIKFKGFLPIFSKTEIILTIILLVLIAYNSY